MSDKKTIQEALAEVQRNAELKKMQEAKAVWGESLDLNEFKFPKFGTPKFKAKPVEPMPHGGEKLTPETPKGKRGPEEINIKPDTSTGKTKIEPVKPAETPKTGGLGSKILGFGLGAALGTAVGDKIANKVKDATSAKNDAPAAPSKPDDSKDMTFGQAFAAARKSATEKGAKSTGQFSWHEKDYQTNVQGKGTPKAPEEKYVAPSKQTKVDIGTTKASAPTSTETPTPTPKQGSGDSYRDREPGWRDTPPQPAPSKPSQGFSGSTKDTTPIGPDPTKFTKPETESGGKKKKMSEEYIDEAGNVVGNVRTGGGNYPIYRRGSNPAQSFGGKGGAYAQAKPGSDFEWQGRKYHKPGEASKPSTNVPLPPKRPDDLGKTYVPQKPNAGVMGTPPMGGTVGKPPVSGTVGGTMYAPNTTKSSETNFHKLPYDTSKPSTTQFHNLPGNNDAPKPSFNPLSSKSVSSAETISTESGEKKKKMSEETNPLIAAFLKLQSENPNNMFEAAKKAKKDYDKDGKIESPKDEVWGSRFAAAKRAGKMEEGNIDPVVTGSSSVTKSKTGYVDPSTPTEPYKKAPMSTGAGDVLNKASDAVFNKKGIKEAYKAVLEAKKAKTRTEDGYDADGNLKNPEDKYDENDRRISPSGKSSSSSDETNDIIKGSAPMKGLVDAGGYGAGEANDPGGRKSRETNDIIRGSAPIKGLVDAGGYNAGEANDPGGRKSKEINDIIKGSAPIKGLVHSGGYSGAAGIYGGNPPKERPANIPKDEYEYFPGMKKDPKGLSYRKVDEARKARTEDGITSSAPIKGLVDAGGYNAGEANDPGGRKSRETNDIIQKSAPIKGLEHSGGYGAVERGEHLYKYNLRTGERIPGGNREMPPGWTPSASGKSNWEKSKEWEPTPTTDEKQAEKDRKWDALKKTLKPLPKDVPEEVEFSQAEIDHLNSFFLEASVAPNRPEVAAGADSVSDKMSQNDVTGTSTESGGKKKVKEETDAADETNMAKTQLKAMSSKAMNLHSKLKTSKNLPAWVQSKLAVAKDGVTAVDDYMTHSGKIKKEVELDEAGMPSSVIAQKQKLANMSDEEFAEKHGNKSEKELRDMAARHGYGWDKATKTGSDHYVKRVASIAMKEETLQEGRPKKNPTPETTERDPRKHIQVEAGRAAAGNVIDFHHNDGTKSKITPAMGRRITSHLQGLKPADRQAAVNKMHDSAEGLKV